MNKFLPQRMKLVSYINITCRKNTQTENKKNNRRVL